MLNRKPSGYDFLLVQQRRWPPQLTIKCESTENTSEYTLLLCWYKHKQQIPHATRSSTLQGNDPFTK